MQKQLCVFNKDDDLYYENNGAANNKVELNNLLTKKLLRETFIDRLVIADKNHSS
jgi:hypothetical protein